MLQKGRIDNLNEAIEYIATKERGYLSDLQVELSKKIIRNFEKTGMISYGAEYDKRESWKVSKQAISMYQNFIKEEEYKSIFHKVWSKYTDFVYNNILGGHRKLNFKLEA